MTDDLPQPEDSERVPLTNRRRVLQGSLAALIAGSMSASGAARGAEEPPFAGPEDYRALVDGLPDNWGRWDDGERDELGAINYLGSEEMYAGMAAAMKQGKTNVERFTLQTPMTGVINRYGVDRPDEEAGDPIFGDRTPAVRDNVEPRGPEDVGDGLNSADDKFVTDLFLQGTTHLDALGHVWLGQQIYNGFDADTTHTPKTFEGDYDGDGDPEMIETFGLGKADISNAASAGIGGRGVLLDVARHVNGDDTPLDLGYDIGLDDLLATARSQGVKLRKRDVLLIRTGSLERYYSPEYDWDGEAEAGLRYEDELVEWVHDMEIPMIGADNIAVEKLVHRLESPADGETKQFYVPLHIAFLQRLGVPLNEILWLEDLADSCAADGIYDFLFSAAPLNVERGSGAPINPVIMKATCDGSENRDHGAKHRGKGSGARDRHGK